VDTSTEYVKMCDCPEIQGQHPWPDHKLLAVRVDDDLMVAHEVWLPYQDQLQEMVQKPEQATWLHVGSWFGHWLHDQYKGEAHPDGRSMEQLWLAYIMGEKHNKRWDGYSWVELH